MEVKSEVDIKEEPIFVESTSAKSEQPHASVEVDTFASYVRIECNKNDSHLDADLKIKEEPFSAKSEQLLESQNEAVSFVSHFAMESKSCIRFSGIGHQIDKDIKIKKEASESEESTVADAVSQNVIVPSSSRVTADSENDNTDASIEIKEEPLFLERGSAYSEVPNSSDADTEVAFICYYSAIINTSESQQDIDLFWKNFEFKKEALLDFGLESQKKVLVEDSEMEASGRLGCAAFIPDKSKTRYERTYAVLKEWLNVRKKAINEKSLLAYFVQRNKVLKSPGSLWAEYSMLKKMIRLNDGINIAQFKKLMAFVKKKNVGHKPKMSKVFGREDMARFLIEAPDDIYLMMKVVMIMGIAGACRREELVNMTIDDIQDNGVFVIVNVPNTNIKGNRTFTIVDKPHDQVCLTEILRKYIERRPRNVKSRRFFCGYRNGRCTNQLVGINAIGRIPANIAKYLNLEDPNSYTGHSFRRTSAMFLANTE